MSLTLQHLQGVFWMWLVGVMVATFTLLLELLWEAASSKDGVHGHQ